MFTVFVSFIILFRIEVFASDPVTKPNFTDESLQQFHVSPFIFQNESIRLNISFGNESGCDLTDEIFVESYDTNEECSFSGNFDISNCNNIIVPALNITYPMENILPGCVYTISIELEEITISDNYTVPECIENFCACLSHRTNLIRLESLELVQGYIYRVYYSQQNDSFNSDNYYITKVYYIKEDTEDRLNIPHLRYLKDAFEIPMEFLKEGENYTLIVQYKDSDNINQNCEYEAEFTFIAQFPWKVSNYVIVKVVGLFLISISLILMCILVVRSVFFEKIIETVKKMMFPTSEEAPIIHNLENTPFRLPHEELNTLYIPLELSDDPYEFPRQNLQLKEVIGEGAFGKVYYAKAYNLHGLPGYSMVAVKLLREGAPKDELADFQAEINMLKRIGMHKNIVKFLGCVTKNQPYMTIMELVANGDLKEYLLKLREVWMKNKNQRLFFPDDMEEKSIKITEAKTDTEDVERFEADMQTPLLSDIGTRPEPVLDHRELENFALQIATGMAYLEKIPVTHRDLAARNILITKEKVLKISDFGMSRSGPYVNRQLKKVPLRWMAIEAIEDFKTDSRSDVWSFGVVLWEIGTLGAFPYEHIPNDLIPKALKSGVRLPRPEICTDDLYCLMQKCWIEQPKDRPTFAEIVNNLHTKKQNVYVDFKRVNPKYVFPPTDP